MRWVQEDCKIEEEEEEEEEEERCIKGGRKLETRKNLIRTHAGSNFNLRTTTEMFWT